MYFFNISFYPFQRIYKYFLKNCNNFFSQNFNFVQRVWNNFGYFTCLHVINHVKHFKVLEKVTWFRMSKFRSVFLNYILLLLNLRKMNLLHIKFHYRRKIKIKHARRDGEREKIRLSKYENGRCCEAKKGWRELRR